MRIDREAELKNKSRQGDVLPKKADLIVVSDVHLKSLDDKEGSLFLALLEAIATATPAHLVLLGDIFDFTLGSNRFFRRKYSRVGESLARIQATGTRVTFVEGNHEFDMAHHGWPGVEVSSELRLALKLTGGEQLLLSHGDGICSPKRYHAYRRIVRSPLFLMFFRLLPGRFIDQLALACSQASRSQDKYRQVDHQRILSLADTWFAAEGSGYSYGLFGHFHEPFAVKGRSYEGKMICLPNWDTPNTLIYHDGKFSRFFLGFDEDHLVVTGQAPLMFSEPEW